MKKLLLLSLFAAIMVLTWQLSEPLTAADKAEVLTRQSSIADLKETMENVGLPPNEIEKRLAAGNTIWDAAEAKGLEPETTDSLMTDALGRTAPSVDDLSSKVVNVINTTDLSNTSITAESKGTVMSSIALAQMVGISPEKVQEMTKTLVEVASDPRADQLTKGNSDAVINAVSRAMMQGMTSENAKQKGEDIMAIAQQLLEKGYDEDMMNTGLINAVTTLSNGKSREETLQTTTIGLEAIKGGATVVAVTLASDSISDAVQAGGDAQKVASAAIGSAQDAITQHQSVVAADVGAATTGTAVINGIAVDQANNMGMKGAEMAAQLEQKVGTLGASSASSTITAGIVNGQNDTVTSNASELAAAKAVELADKGNGLAAIQVGADITGQTMLNTQNANISNLAGDVGAQSMTNVLDQGGGTLAGELAATAAGDSIISAGAGATEGAATEGVQTDEEVQKQTSSDEPVPNPPVPVEPPPPINDQPVASDQP